MSEEQVVFMADGEVIKYLVFDHDGWLILMTSDKSAVDETIHNWLEQVRKAGPQLDELMDEMPNGGFVFEMLDFQYQVIDLIAGKVFDAREWGKDNPLSPCSNLPKHRLN